MQSDVVLAMLICSLLLQDVPMGFREKVILCVLIMKYLDSCMQLGTLIQTESDIIWVNNQIKKMEAESNNDDSVRGSDFIEWDRTSDE